MLSRPVCKVMTFEKLCRLGASCIVVVVSTYESSQQLIDSAPELKGVEALEALPKTI